MGGANTGDQTASGRGWAVATPHHLASRAAGETLRRGGNAVDAALAAAATLTVVYPNQTSVGGDLLALVGDARGRIQFVNASGAAAAGLDVDAVLSAHSGVPIDGAEAVTVPGVVSGWETLADGWGRSGRSGWARTLRDAASLARDGFTVSPGLGRDLVRESARLARDPGMRGVFFAGGEVLRTGATLQQPALADTLETIAQGGADAMYRGGVGHSLVSFLREHGSYLTTEDFAAHQVDLDVAHSTTFAGEEYLSAAANSQGVFFLAALAALELLRDDHPLDPLGADAGVVAAVLAHAAAERDERSADPRFVPVPVEELLSTGHAARWRDDARAGRLPRRRAHARALGDTVAVVAADADGTWVSLIQSVFHCFGAGLLEPTTGVVVHNRGASFSAEAASPNRLGPGKRPLHTLMPVLVRRDGVLVGAHGAMGGRAQPQIHAHVALGLARGLSPHEAVAAPRWVLDALEAGAVGSHDLVRNEPGVPDSAVEAISREGLRVGPLPQGSDEVGHAQVIRRQGDQLVGAADPRADGEALAGPADPVMVTG